MSLKSAENIKSEPRKLTASYKKKCIANLFKCGVLQPETLDPQIPSHFIEIVEKIPEYVFIAFPFVGKNVRHFVFRLAYHLSCWHICFNEFGDYCCRSLCPCDCKNKKIN